MGAEPLIDQLIDRQSDDRQVQLETLRAFAARPQELARLDEEARELSPPAPPRSTPISLAFAAGHPDESVRERAVAIMVAAPDPAWLPFLVLRCADEAAAVRERARTGLVAILVADQARFLPAALPMAMNLRDLPHGGFAYAQALVGLQLSDAESRESLLAAAGPEIRRHVLELGLTHGWRRR